VRRSSIFASLIALLLAAGCNSSPAAQPTDRANPGPPSHEPPITALRAPVGLATVGEKLWAVSSAEDQVVEVDPATGAVGRRVPVGATPLRVAAVNDQLWVTVFRAGKVVVVDTKTARVVREVALGGGPEGITAAFGSVWVVRQDARRLTRLDPSGKVLGEVPLPGKPRLVAATARHVWVSDYAGGTLTRVDPTTKAVRTTPKACDGAQGLAANPAILWVTCTRSNEVLAVEATAMRLMGRATVPAEPDAIRFIEGRLFLVSTAGPSLVELRGDPEAPAIRKVTALGNGAPLADAANLDLAAAGGRIWVSSFRDNGLFAVAFLE